MSIAKKLQERGIVLPKTTKPAGNYVLSVCEGGFLFTAGQLPRVDGMVKHTGKMGLSVTIEEGYQAARICALNCLALIDEAVGLDAVERFVKLTGFVNATPDFTDTTAVINGASDVLAEIFGEKSAHARSAIGVQSLPQHAVCEVEMIVRVKA